jgi:hypothetical protein
MKERGIVIEIHNPIEESVAEILVGRGRGRPPTHLHGKLTNFRIFWPKRGLKTVFSSANWGVCWKFESFVGNLGGFAPPPPEISATVRSYLFKSNEHEKLTFNWLVLEVHWGCLLTCNSVALPYFNTHTSVSVYTLSILWLFSPPFLILYSLKTNSIRFPLLAIKTNHNFWKPTSIQNRQQDAESRKNFVRSHNRFNQPILGTKC